MRPASQWAHAPEWTVRGFEQALGSDIAKVWPEPRGLAPGRDTGGFLYGSGEGDRPVDVQLGHRGGPERL